MTGDELAQVRELLLHHLQQLDDVGEGASVLHAARESESVLDLVRVVVAREEHRSAVLEAIRGTAMNVIGVREVHDVLELAIEHAQSLLGTEIAYVSTYDEGSGLNVVRAAVGTRSETFVGTTVPFGVGLGGIVAKTQQPFVTYDYLIDERLSHLPDVDDTMRSEGIRAIISAPLIVDGHVVGALYAADRTPRQYRQDEVQVLLSFAGLAALAIDNARLFEAREESLRSLQEAYASLRARNDDAEKAATIQSDLAGIVAKGGRLDDIVQLLSSALRMSVAVYDDLDQLQHHAQVDDANALGPELASTAGIKAMLVETSRSGRAEETSTGSGGPHVGMRVQVGAAHVGSLVASVEEPLRGYEMRAFESAAMAASGPMLQDVQTSIAAAQSGGGSLEALLDGRLEPGEWLRVVRSMPGPVADVWTDDVEQHATALLIEAADPGPAEMLALQRRAVHAGGFAYLGRAGRQLAVHCVGAWPAEDNERIVSRLTRGWAGAATSIGGADVPVSALVPLFRELRAALPLAHGLGHEGAYTPLAALERVTSDLPLTADPARVSAFVSSSVGPLLAYDSNRGTELVDTLAAYLDLGRNARRVADRLGIHYKTVQQRLDRIVQVLDVDWDDSSQVLGLQLALHLHHAGVGLWKA